MPPSLPYTRLLDKSHSFIDHFAVSEGFEKVSYCSNLIVYNCHDITCVYVILQKYIDYT